jgi:hypothetical protein
LSCPTGGRVHYRGVHVELAETLDARNPSLVSGAEGVAVCDARDVRNGVGRLLAYEDGAGPLGDAEGMVRREPAQRAEGVEEVDFELLGSCDNDMVDVAIFDPKTGRPQRRDPAGGVADL